MSKKNFTGDSFRNIGNQKYKQDERPGARPPDAWDDISLGRESLAPLRHAKRMKDLGHTREEAIARLQNKWHLDKNSCAKIVDKAWSV